MYYVYEIAKNQEFLTGSFETKEEARKEALYHANRGGKVEIRAYTAGTLEEAEETNCFDYDPIVWGLANEKQIRADIEKILIDFEVEFFPHQQDIYLYVDSYGIGKVETFTNVGGNSWLSDDHFTLYSDRGIRDKSSIFEGYDFTGIIDALGLDADEVIKAAIEAGTIDEEEAEEIKGNNQIIYEMQNFLLDNYESELIDIYKSDVEEWDFSGAVDACIDNFYAALEER